ncbi:MAG TPA: PAS domain-containing protein [Micropepsaceae bacterium]|nr:PAS domain-containing protein [Micropepsaceae bacterium]
MKHRNSHFAVGYWSRIRNGRATPDQADIDPKALKRLLPFVFLLDSRGGSFTYRLAGTTLCERYGSELRGRDYFLHWDPESSARLAELLRQSLRARLPLCLTSIGAVDHCHMIEIETVLMPITFGSDHPERFLGVAQVLTDVTPLAGQPISFERLVTSKLVREEDAGTINPPSAPPPPSAHDGWRAHPRAPHLRLVSSRVSMDANNDPLSIDAGGIVNNLVSFVAKLKSGSADIGPF